MVRSRTLAAFVAASGACCLLGIATASAQATAFGRPIHLATGGLESVAINAKGEALALWVGTRAVRVARRDARGRWHRSVTLGRARSCQENFNTGISTRGDAVVAWTEGCIEGPAPRLRVATRRAGQQWSNAGTIARVRGSVGLGMTSRGEAILGWGTGRGATLTSWHGRGWSAPIRLGHGGAYPLSFGLHVRATGQALAAWSSGTKMISSRRARRGAWTPPETIPVAAQFSTETAIQLGRDRDGRIIAVGPADVPPASFAVETVDYQPTRGWSPPRLLAVSDDPVRPSLAMNDRGDAVLGWAQRMPASAVGTQAPYGHDVVFTAVRTPGGDWSAAERMSSDRVERSAWVIKTGISPGGELFAIWANTGPPSIQAATGTVTTGWRAPFRVGSTGDEPKLAVADGPHAIIGWAGTGDKAVTVAVTKRPG